MPVDFNLGHSGFWSQGLSLSTSEWRPHHTHPLLCLSHLVLPLKESLSDFHYPSAPNPWSKPRLTDSKTILISLLNSPFLVTQTYVLISLSHFLRAPPNIPVFFFFYLQES